MEDPTNKNVMFARNSVRAALEELGQKATSPPMDANVSGIGTPGMTVTGAEHPYTMLYPMLESVSEVQQRVEHAGIVHLCVYTAAAHDLS